MCFETLGVFSGGYPSKHLTLSGGGVWCEAPILVQGQLSGQTSVRGPVVRVDICPGEQTRCGDGQPCRSHHDTWPF